MGGGDTERVLSEFEGVVLLVLLLNMPLLHILQLHLMLLPLPLKSPNHPHSRMCGRLKAECCMRQCIATTAGVCLGLHPELRQTSVLQGVVLQGDEAATPDTPHTPDCCLHNQPVGAAAVATHTDAYWCVILAVLCRRLPPLFTPMTRRAGALSTHCPPPLF
jgi:hypothetical protein